MTPYAETNTAVSLYRFSTALLMSDIDADLILLRRVKAPATEEFLLFASELSPADLRDLALAMVRRFHPVAVKELSEINTPRQEALFQKFNGWRNSRLLGFSDVVVGSPAKTAPAASRKQMVEAIRRCIRQSSTQRFNNPDDGFSKDGVELTFPVGAWDVCSTLGFGGRGKCIFYWNHIASKERSIPHGVPYRWLYHSESICSMLGISGMTKWDVVPKSCLDEWAQTVVDLWELFYGFADTLGLAEIA